MEPQWNRQACHCGYKHKLQFAAQIDADARSTSDKIEPARRLDDPYVSMNLLQN